MTELAIVLPIYKPDFLRETLESIASQSNHDFMAYLCDDCSPHDLAPIIRQFEGRFPFKYIRFEENLGGKDLVSHWERCIAQTQGEHWLWIFSDDDMMDPDCVDSFYQAREQNPSLSLFHFNVQVIDSFGKPTTDKHYIKEDFPSIMSAQQFLHGRLSYRLNSFIVDYIFSRDHFMMCGGFVHYDLAWCSDDATWYRLAIHTPGIATIPHVHVHWRKSDSNITPDHSSNTMLRKLKATRQHLHFCKQHLPYSTMIRLNYYLHALYNARCLGTRTICYDFLRYMLYNEA